MLRKLYIRNFALIREMDVAFPGGLTVITGETGAGKSIFLEALGLVLGKRADVSALQDQTQKCIIEAEFELNHEQVQPVFTDNDLSFENPTIIRREISAEGKSRSFLNDSPVSLAVLKQLSEYVIDIHSQHETLLLGNTQFRFDMVDAFAGSNEAFKTYRKTWQHYQTLLKQQTQLEEQEQKAKKEHDYIQFLFNELHDVRFEPNDLKRWEEESATLENAEYIKQQLNNTNHVLNASETSALAALNQAKQALAGISKFSETYSHLHQRLQSIIIEFKDLVNELETEAESVNLNPQQLALLNEKIDQLQRLFKKHGVTTENDLLAEKEKLEQQLLRFNSLATQIEKGQLAINQALADCQKQAQALSKQRLSVLNRLETEMTQTLQDLAMPNARFKAELIQQTTLGNFGLDELRFLFSANKGGEFKELQKVASGGELSRVMLSLKSLLAGKKQLPTIIFDEIDTGVSGEIASKMGTILGKMGETMQVISITHLPQIASKGQHHLFVYKQDDDTQTNSLIKALNKEERVTEVAKMLSSGTPTHSALKNAKELLSV